MRGFSSGTCQTGGRGAAGRTTNGLQIPGTPGSAPASQQTAETLAKTNPLLKPDQLQKVVVDGIAKGAVGPSHAGFAELSQTVRASLDPLWQPQADVKTVLSGVCAKIAPQLAKQ